MEVALAVAALCGLALSARGERQMENLSRGLVAVPRPEGGMFVGWRLFATDPEDVAFHVYRARGDGPAERISDEPIGGATCLIDAAGGGGPDVRYHVRPVVAGVEGPASRAVRAWTDGFIDIPIERREGYRPGDASVGDLDGDGDLEIVLHQVSRPRDNGSPGLTGAPILEAYEFDGTLLWRINLGINVREGEHYTQFMVYDLDGDGCAEVACKTADGSVDGVGRIIGAAGKDWRTLDPGSPRHGRILAGPEYLTVFRDRPLPARPRADRRLGRHRRQCRQRQLWKSL